MTVHNSIYKILVKPYADSGNKEKIIKENLDALSANEQAEYNQMKMQFQKRKRTILPFILGTCTFGAFLIGVWRLPSRKSTAVYTLSGLGTGIAISYGCWRYWAYQYY